MPDSKPVSVEEIAKLTFSDPRTGDEVFMMVHATARMIYILLTTNHSGDIEVGLERKLCAELIDALEQAALVQSQGEATEQHIVSLQSKKEDDIGLRVGVDVDVQEGLVDLYLTLEGVENEEDDVGVFLRPDECAWLRAALQKAIPISEQLDSNGTS